MPLVIRNVIYTKQFHTHSGTSPHLWYPTNKIYTQHSIALLRP